MLKEEIKAIIGNRRRFLLLRIADIDTETSRKLCGIKKGTYNSWCQDSRFVELYRRRDEFSVNYKQEAIQLLRRDNQLAAVLLESRIIAKMKEELESGAYLEPGVNSLLRTNLAKEVYSKLINDLDYQPPNLSLTWEQRVQQLVEGQENPQIEESGAINGEIVSETIGESQTEHPQSNLPLESEQTSDEIKKKAKKG